MQQIMLHRLDHSLRKDFTGFILDTFNEWYKTHRNAIDKTATPVPMNTRGDIGALYAKLPSHLLMKYQAIGQPTRFAINTSFRKSIDNILTSAGTDAPITRRMPISFVLRFAMNAVRPNKPRPPSMIESIEKEVNIFKKRSSAR